MCEASVPCMCLYVYTLYLSRTFILSIKTSIHFHWDLTINSHEAKIVQQQQHRSYLESLYVLLQCTRAVYLCCTKTSCRQKNKKFLKAKHFRRQVLLCGLEERAENKIYITAQDEILAKMIFSTMNNTNERLHGCHTIFLRTKMSSKFFQVHIYTLQ